MQDMKPLRLTLAKLAMPLGCAALLIFGCSQNAGAEKPEQDRQTRASARGGGDQTAAGFQTEEATQPGIPDPSEAEGNTPATCVAGNGNPAPGTMAFGPSDTAAGTVVAFKLNTQRDNAGNGTAMIFRGNRQGRWWSGTLNGKPAMGYELNRGHVVFNTRTLDQAFEYWTQGKEHGSY